MKTDSRLFPLLLGLALLTSGLRADDKPASVATQPPGTQEQVLGLFRTRCVECHGPRQQKARLNLASLDGIARGSRKGPIVRPGKPTDSLLWEMVHDDRMPPEKPLTESERQLLRAWIVNGAPGLHVGTKNGPANHWAFQPPQRPPVPAVQPTPEARTAIDHYILAALESKGLTLSPEADRGTLLRRVSSDLTGLPPTVAELAAFLADPAPDAYERMVERYLASPHYGERWGKYWLDAAGYADSNGYFSADTDRPLAYRYRDYVIRSFNADKPYDRFVQEQLAGDELAGYDPDGDVTPEMVEGLIATHFLRNAPDGTGESDGNPDEVRTDRFTVLEGTLHVTLSSLLGITIQCARCHGHKFEPITHEEYYQLQAIFYPAYCPDRWLVPKERVVSIATRAQREDHQRRNEPITQQIKALQDSLGTITGPFKNQLLEERLQPLEPAQRAAVVKAFNTAKKKRTPEQEALLMEHAQAVALTDDDVGKRFPEYAAVRTQIRQAVAAREKQRPAPLPQIAVFVEPDSKPPVHHVLLRGQHTAPGPEVQPGVPAALCTPGNSYQLAPLAPGRKSSGRRTALARWVTSPENPLFARVLVNRIWQQHFGVGIVTTPENFGQSGSRPSHPELLDYLATEFVRSGWSIKALHRRILHSAVYRQMSALREDAFAVDPDNHWLWRFPLRRLDAEAVRDALLQVSAELDRRLEGPYVPTRRTGEGNVEVDEKRPGARRRSVYLQQRRTQVPTLLQLFDAPTIVVNCTARTSSTVPLQSLALLNSDFIHRRAQAFAKRLEQEAGPDAQKRLSSAFVLACGREPSPEERAAATNFLTTQQQLYAREPDAGERAWSDLCQMVLASNAFLYVE